MYKKQGWKNRLDLASTKKSLQIPQFYTKITGIFLFEITEDMDIFNKSSTVTGTSCGQIK
jgi:hypothetical protein